MQLVRRFIARWSGVVYVVLSMACSLVYIEMIKDSMTNDLFWPNMSLTGAQTYLIQLISRCLVMKNKMVLDLFDPSNAIIGKFGSSLASHELWSSYPRYIVFSELTSLRDAITGFRSFDATYTFNLFTQYCWVDFDHRWEIAHTFSRQKRCYQRYQANGAVYLEGIMRNVNWDSWTTVYYPNFMQGVGNYVIESSEGRAWMAGVPNAFRSIDSEVKYWTDKGIMNYILQWNNCMQIGISESITVVNVFGTHQLLTTNHFENALLVAKWTTFGLYWAFVSDLFAATAYNASLVRNSTNFIGNDKFEASYVYPDTRASVVIHDILGPFNSIDAFFITPSNNLINVIISFDSVLLTSLQANEVLYTKYQKLTTIMLDAVPKTWRQFDYQYFSGSPMCNSRAPTAFVQSTFSFDDVCGQPKPMQITIQPQSALFAYTRLRAAGISPIDSCGLCLTTTAECLSLMHQLDTIYDELVANATISEILKDAPDLSSMEVEVIQFARLNSTSVILRQSLFEGPWSFYGYVGVYEWVYGHREVISFEGDHGIFVVLSEPLNSIPFTTGTAAIPNTTSQFLWAVALCTSVVLLIVAAATLSMYLGHNTHLSHDLFFFHHIAGPVWLGRSLMLLRSTTAIIVLSTSSIVFESSIGIGRFRFEPRSIFSRFLLAFEALWLTDLTIDVLLVFTHDIARLQAPLSSAIFWLAVVFLESISPIRATAVIERSCSRINMDNDLTCASGVVSIGSPSRAIMIIALSLASVVLGSVIAKCCIQIHAQSSKPAQLSLLPAATLAFCSPNGNMWTMEASIACMSGLFRFHYGNLQYVLDTKLWLMFTDIDSSPTKLDPNEFLSVNTVGTSVPVYKRKKQLLLIAGLIYLTGTIAGSLSYIQLANVNFSNDLWWANFNATGALTFIANWYAKYRVFTPYLPNVQLDSPAFADDQDYSQDNTVVYNSPLYASMVHFDATNNIAQTIEGLRRTDGCLIPWIATQYCWLDFDRKYTMASTLRRQERCQMFQTNGAVYLEAPLRNMDWSEFESCWGTSFDIAVAKELHGSKWLANVKSNINSIAEEVVYWVNYNVTTYTVQWQNYKVIGLIDTFSIENALGISYQITLQSTHGFFHLGQESSMKMYWTFARDLWAISMNNSGISGLSLLRESNRFAFQNTTPLAVYMRNNTLTAPLDPNFVVFSIEIGPFGSVDLFHVPPPRSLRNLTQQILESVSTALATNGATCQNAFLSLPVVATMLPVPMALRPHLLLGGSILCEQIPVPTPGIRGMRLFYSADASCSLDIGELIFPLPNQVLFASIASEMNASKIPVACSGEISFPLTCVALLQNLLNFTSTYMPTVTYRSIIQETIRDVAEVEMMQYIINTSTSSRQVFHQALLDPVDPGMLIFGWMYLYDWVMGLREVVQMKGDNEAISIISTHSSHIKFAVDAMQVPRNLAAYSRAFCQYVSCVLAMVGIIAGMYSLQNRFTSEGFNLFETNRVGGLVWIGRPLLLVRSLTALVILSTATLELQDIGSMTVMVCKRSNESEFKAFMTNLLAAGEATWLMYIIQDLAMVYTRETTTLYGPISGVSMWFISFCLSVAAPVSHQTLIHRQCSIDTIDYQLVCSTGSVVIGSFRRFLTLFALCFGVSIVFYLYHQCRHSKSRRVDRPLSLLSCGAQYLFDRSGWVRNDIYYIDYASAALAGLITIPTHHKLYVFDIKSWRIVEIDRIGFLNSNDIDCSHLRCTLPLVK